MVAFPPPALQPSFIALITSCWSPVFPAMCRPGYASQAGRTGVQIVEFKPNESIKVAATGQLEAGRRISTG